MSTSKDNVKTIAVLLATGQQGSNVIKALLQSKSKRTPNLRLNIIGLTRDPSSNKCKTLLSQWSSLSDIHSIHFLKCNISNKNELFTIFTKYKVWGVYCVTVNYFNGTDQQTIDGKACIDAAMESNVSFFILSSVVGAYTAPKAIPGVNAKYEIDQYLINQTTFNEVFADGWLVLRTTWYMDNLFTYYAPKNGYLTIPIIDGDVKYAVVALENIGHIAADYFVGNKEIKTCFYDCIGDDISGNEMCKVLSKISGQNVSYYNRDIMWNILNVLGVRFAVDHTAMLEWYNTGAIHGNIEQCYQDFGDKMIDFKEFAEKHFRNKYLGESIARKIVKYSTAIIIIGSIAAAGAWFYKRKIQQT